MKLILKNFQVHEYLEVPLDSSITTIVGSTDCGKSAVIRALRWLFLNKPRGDSFVRNGAKETEVCLEVEGHCIKRIRSAKRNVYEIDGTIYENVSASGIPSQVSSICRVFELSFQGQHDSPFWFSLSSGEVSRQLNSLVDLDIIDRSLAFVTKEIREEGIRLRTEKDKYLDTKDKFKDLSFVRTVRSDFDGLKDLSLRHEKLVTDYVRLDGMIENSTQYIVYREDVAEILKAMRALYDMAQRFEILYKLVADIEERSRHIKIRIPKLDGLFDLADKLKEKDQALSRFTTLYSKLVNTRKDLNSLVIELRSAREVFLKEMPSGECPLCGGIIK